MMGKLVNCELESNMEGSGGGVVNVLSRPSGLLIGQAIVFQCELVVFFFPDVICTVILINPFNTKRYPIKTQSVPRSKHFISVTKTVTECCIGK